MCLRVLDVPAEERLEALQCTSMLLPDENREVLQSLLLFLSDMASHSHLNQVSVGDIAYIHVLYPVSVVISRSEL